MRNIGVDLIPRRLAASMSAGTSKSGSFMHLANCSSFRPRATARAKRLGSSSLGGAVNSESCIGANRPCLAAQTELAAARRARGWILVRGKCRKANAIRPDSIRSRYSRGYVSRAKTPQNGHSKSEKAMTATPDLIEPITGAPRRETGSSGTGIVAERLGGPAAGVNAVHTKTKAAPIITAAPRRCGPSERRLPRRDRRWCARLCARG